uniref:Uncharacterized protein n=1 Tax=Oryza meridionalis TaxID=40149 RepID=A0A0E0DVW6_9ORYZ
MGGDGKHKVTMAGRGEVQILGPLLEVRGDRGARCDGGGYGGAGHQDGAPAGGAGLSVANGEVSVERPESPSAASLVKYKVTLRAYNPSGRAVVHFGGDNLVRLIYGAAAWTLLAASTLPAFVVPQQESHFVTKSAFLNASALPASLAARLYDGETDQVVVQAVASLSFTIGGARGVSAGKRGHNFTFHCWPVSISSYYEVTLRAYNPSGRAVVHFGGDNLVRLIYGAAAQTELAAFTLPAFVVPQQESHYVTKSAFLNASALPASLAARLYDGETDQVVVQAVASLSFTIGGARGVSTGKRGHNFTFHCWPVSISSYYEVSGGEASCSQDTTQAAVAGLTHDRCIGGPCPEPYKNSGNCSGNSTGTGSKG